MKTRLWRYTRKPAVWLGFSALLLIAAYVSVSGRTLEPIELRVGYNSFVPYVVDGPNGQVSGLAVEIINEAARRAHIHLTYVYVASGEDINGALRSGEIDIFPLLTLTSERTKEFHTSEAWWENETALISLKRSPVSTAAETRGKQIAIRGLHVLQAIAIKLFPDATLIKIPEIDRLVSGLCKAQVDAIFLDVQLLQSQLLQGPADCVGKALSVKSLPEGRISLGTVARKEVSQTADKMFEQIEELIVDGTLSAKAYKYSVVSSMNSSHMMALLAVQRRALAMRYGLGGLLFILLLFATQTHRISHARNLAEESRQRFDAFMKHTPAITFIKNEKGGLIYTNQGPESVENADLFLQRLARQLNHIDATVLETNRTMEVTECLTNNLGEKRYFLCLKFPFSSKDGPRFIGTVALDITARRRAEDALRFSQFSIDRSPDLILWLDAMGKIFYANEAAVRKLGFSKDELCLMRLDDVDCGLGTQLFARSRAELKARGSMNIESLHRMRDGSIFPVELILNYLDMDGQGAVCCMSRDITARKRAEGELSYQAQHDLLTGLPNRRYFESRLSTCLDASRLMGSGLAVFYFDLDGFKLINDSHGHNLGDALLRQVVGRLAGAVRDTDTLARMGGDEFTLIANGIEGREAALAVAEKLLAALRDSFVIDEHELLITASFGITMFPGDGEDGTTLLRHADAAMYEAKREGKDRVKFFHPKMNTLVCERLELENHLRRALERDEFALHYQPEVCLKTDRIVRNEALIRWNHPTLGTIPPVKFITIAEETGLIVPIGNWVLEEACLQTRRMMNSGVNIGVGVNVSSVQFARTDYVETVAAILRRTGLPPFMLELELTESIVMHGIDEAAAKIHELRATGVAVSIDDFGTGYSSLSYLQKLRIDNLKIDRSFIQDVPTDKNALDLTRALVSLAHSLGMRVVIEGIENKQQLDAVRAIGCDVAQGFYLGRPAAPECILTAIA